MKHNSTSLLIFALTALVTLPVSDLAAQGRVKWRYQANASYFSMRPVVAKDGTVYAVDIAGTLHAIQANGKSKWTLPNAGRKGVDVAADGTVYVGDQTKIHAVRPNGTVKWTYPISPVAHTLFGPTVGPDGNIYANAPSGPGMLSLTPAGKLRWATPTRAGRPWVQSQELVFRPSTSSRGLQVFYSGHGELAQIETSNGKLTQISYGGDYQPAIGPGGDLYSTASRELRAFKPDGSPRWSILTRQTDGISDPSIGRDGIVYAVKESKLLALRPADGSEVWRHDDWSHLRMPMVSPTNHLVLVNGRTRGGTDFVRAVDLRGGILWQIDLRTLAKSGPLPTMPARFTRDGTTAYVGTMFDNNVCYLYAIDTSSAARAGVWTWGRACRGVSTKLPNLGFTGRPVLGSTFSVDLADARGNAAAVHMIGFQQTRVSFNWQGAPDGTAYVIPAVTVPLQTDLFGAASSPLAVPNVAALAGLQLFHQFAIADPVNRLGVVATVGGGCVLGK